jgi:hypothetical protein
MRPWCLYLLAAIVLLQSALLWKLCALHRALLADVACVPVIIDDEERPPARADRGGPLL